MKRLVKESLNGFYSNKSKERRENIDVHKLRNELESIKERLRYLSQVHHPMDDNPWGDGTVRDMRNKLNNRKKQIMNLLETPEDFEKRAEREYQTRQKRTAQQREKREEKEEKLKKLTPKQKAINRIIDLKYNIRVIKDPKFTKEARSEIEKLKDEFNIKSYDLRRQKEYDPKYE